jgi:nitrogen regulatory protein PII
MHKLIVAIIRQETLDNLTSALKKERINFTYSEVKGYCGEVHLYQKDIHKRIKMEVLSNEEDVEKIKDIIMANASCGLEGDGCLSVYVLDEHVMFAPDTKRDIK